MLKKSMATALLVCSIPAVASASWFLSTQVKTGGGSLTTRNLAGQVVTDGAIFKSYTASQGTMVVSAAAADGFVLQSLTVDGQAFVNGNAITIDGNDKNVSAVFLPVSFGAAASFADGNGMVTPAAVGNLYKGYELKSDLTFTFSPKVGYKIDAVNNVPVDPKVIVTGLPAATNAKVKVTFKSGYKFDSALALSATASNQTVGLDAILPQTVAINSKVTMIAAGNGVDPKAATWTYVSGPANTVTFGNYTAVDPKTGQKDTKVGTTVKPGPALVLDTATLATDGKVKVTPTTPGQYKFTVTVNGDTKMAVINVLATTQDAANQCQFCHTANKIDDLTIGARYQGSIHGNNTHSSCQACHFGSGAAHPGNVSLKTVNLNNLQVKAGFTGIGPNAAASAGQVFCINCHNPIPHNTDKLALDCVTCHTSPTGQGGTNDVHSIQGLSCKGCHSVAQSNPFNGIALVSDNNNNTGVRAVTGEFSKWSHHIVNPNGMEPLDEQCAVCHLEGTVGNYGFSVDGTKHMTDNKIHLRDTTNNLDEDFAWDPATPDHSGMDRFCMSCHDSNGADSPIAKKLQALISPITGRTASPTNPFGDTLSNRYDKMQRPAVVDAKGQFDINNPSHHAVRGQRYTKRTRVINAADPRAMTATEVAAFTNNSGAASTTKTVGARSTIYDSHAKRVTSPDGYGTYDVSKFVSTYETLTGPPTAPADKTLGDDSVLHCGDCHTVGQYRQADVNVLPKNKAVIGAHGSNNEYMLRNSIGTDERHVGQTYSSASGVNYYTNLGAPLLVCFNCHSYQQYGTIGNATGATGTNHAGEYANSNRCNGPINTITFAGYTTGAETDGEQYLTRLGEGSRDGIVTGSTSTADTDYSNLFGMQCANCHNSGPNNAFGGIHGAKVQTYTDANGKDQKAYRFLPGLGNTMFVPGSVAGVGSVSDINWEQKQLGTYYDAGKTVVTDNSGCYTLVPDPAEALTDSANNAPFSGSPTFEQQNSAGQTLFGTWGGCDDHRGNAHGKAFATGSTQGPGNAGWIDPVGGTYNTGGAGAVRKTLRPVTY